MCSTKMPRTPAAPAAAPLPPIETAKTLKPSKARAKRRASEGTDVLSSLRIPLLVPGAPPTADQIPGGV